jgi:hypothetical protein
VEVKEMRTDHGSVMSGRCPVRVLAWVAIGWLTSASVAHGQAVGLSWDGCGSGVSIKTFACDTNVGGETVVVSFVAPLNLPKVAKAEVQMAVCFENLVSLGWWEVQGFGVCRPGALTGAIAPPDGDCAPIWDPAGGTTVQIIVPRGVTGLGGFEFDPIASLSDSSRTLDMARGQRYELMRLRIDNAQTVGAGACGGCSIGASIVANSVWLYSTDGHGYGTAGSTSISWQKPTNCIGFTPVRKSTWGAVKTLYR